MPAMPIRSAALAALLGLFAALAPATADATWSIVAVDAATREVGVAGASCIGQLQVIARVVPGRGAVAAQALWNLDGRDLAARELAAGTRPAEIVTMLTRRSFDGWQLPRHRLRQYGIAALGAPAASYTGKWTIPWTGAAQAEGVTVQGNLLRGPEVVRDALAAFVASDAACGLGERLLRALEAGAAAGGDRRCSPEQAALSAFVEIARPGDAEGASTLRLVVPRVEKGGANPVEQLRHELDAWRALHPEGRC
jgi:uncharacterized Ntn-hydrolase superfamily protein